MTQSTAAIEEQWFARYERDRDGFIEILTKDVFRDWERLALPEARVEQDLINGLDVAYAWGTDNEHAAAFFRRASDVAQRTIDEDKLTSPLCASRLPKSRGALYRAYTFARALLGERLDVEALRQSSRDFEEWCKAYKKGEWDSQAQANYLAAVRLAILAEEIDRARELVSRKKLFKWHKSEHELWKRLVESSRDVRGDEAFEQQFMAFFDKLRDPQFVSDVYMETDILRLELAVIRDKYLVSEDHTISWSRAVDSVPGG